MLLLCAALLGTALAVDPAADNAFDAPKRFLALSAIAAAAAFAFAGTRAGSRLDGAAAPWREGPPLHRAVPALFVLALVAAGLSAVLSPRRAVALDAFRALLLYALLLPLGASRALRNPRPLLAVFLGVSAVNATVSLLQATGLFSPFRIRAWGNWEATGAFAGNVGYLAIALGIAAVAAFAVALAARTAKLRVGASAAALLCLAGVVVNQNLTSLMAVAAGGAVVAFAGLRRRAWLPIALVLAALAAGALLYRPLRVRAAEAIAAAQAGDWDRLVTYRSGAWAAARAMAAERPILGWGPGTFGPEFVPHRLTAEIRARRRHLNPLVTSSYAEAHSDYLQPFAEGGVIGGSAAVASAALLLVLLFRAIRRIEGARRTEAVLLAAMLVAGATAALTWFPLQRPITALPLLLAAGRAWRVIGEPA